MAEIKYDEDVIGLYAAFSEFYNPNSVLYPFCGYDGSVSAGFGKDKVTHVDKDEGVVAAFKRSGLIIFGGDIGDYKTTGLHDLLILKNPGIGMEVEKTTEHLQKNGFILMNRDAMQLYIRDFKDSDEFDLWGSIDYILDEHGNRQAVVTEGTENFFESVESLEELRKISPAKHESFLQRMNGMSEQILQPRGIIPKSPEETYRHLIENGTFSPEEILPFKQDPAMYVFTKV